MERICSAFYLFSKIDFPIFLLFFQILLKFSLWKFVPSVTEIQFCAYTYIKTTEVKLIFWETQNINRIEKNITPLKTLAKSRSFQKSVTEGTSIAEGTSNFPRR